MLLLSFSCFLPSFFPYLISFLISKPLTYIAHLKLIFSASFFIFSLLNKADTNIRLHDFLHITISFSNAYDTVKVTMKHMGESGIGNSKHILHWHSAYSLFSLSWQTQQICRMSTRYVLSFRIISLVPNRRHSQEWIWALGIRSNGPTAYASQ